MKPSDRLDFCPAQHPDVAARVYEGEAVIVLPIKGEVLVLNGVGSRVWELADGTRSVPQIVQEIVDEYDVALDQAREDIAAFIQVLEVREVLTWREPAN